MRHNHNTKTCLQWHLALMGYFAFTDTSQLYHKIYIATEHIFKVKLNKKLQTNTPRDVQSSVCVTAPQLYFLPCADSQERDHHCTQLTPSHTLVIPNLPVTAAQFTEVLSNTGSQQGSLIPSSKALNSHSLPLSLPSCIYDAPWCPDPSAHFRRLIQSCQNRFHHEKDDFILTYLYHLPVCKQVKRYVHTAD